MEVEMKKIWISIILSMVLFSSCTTFSSFYDPWYEEGELRNIITLQEGEEPRIIRSNSNNMNDDVNEILSNNYIIIGTTSFNGPDDDITNSIKRQCRQNGATIALYGKDYTDTRSGIYRSGNYYSTYNVRRYDYAIYYFVQRTFLPALGWRVINLDNENRRIFQRNTGVIVHVVLKNTSVFYANIVRNDIIVRINEHIINNVDDYWETYDNLNTGDVIEVEYIRNNRSNILNIRVE
jgi:hypothetical protein